MKRLGRMPWGRPVRGPYRESQVKTKLGGATAWTKRSKKSGEFMAVKKPAKKTKAAKKFKGVRVEKKAGKKKKARAGGQR